MKTQNIMTLKRGIIGYFIWIPIVVLGVTSSVLAQNNLGQSPFTSPRIVNLDGDPTTLKIIAGDEAGNLNGFEGGGNLLWQVALKVGGVFSTSIQGTPAGADIDNDELLEFVVTTGNISRQATSPGGVFVVELLDRAGLLPPLVRQIFTFEDRNADALEGTADSSVVSPAIADVDNDGDLDIVVASFDQVVRALDINGKPLWSEVQNLSGKPTLITGLFTGDTVFSSPAIANIDSDPQPEVIIGINVGLARDCNAPLSFTIPKQGGGVLVIDGKSGKIDTNTPFARPDPACPNKARILINTDEIVNSTPSVADINGDGILDIVHGTGGPFFNPPPSRNPTVFAWSTRDGRLLWSKTTAGFQVSSSPAIGDVDGDGIPEVFVTNDNHQLYGFKGTTGALLPGFPRQLNRLGNGKFLDSPVLGDVDGDGVPEIVVVAFGVLNIVKADGTIQSSIIIPSLTANTPAIGDIDGDGLHEIVVEGHKVEIRRTTGGGPLPWPQFKANARGTSKFNDTDIEINPPKLPVPIAGAADYNGDGMADISVWRPDTGEWFAIGASSFPSFGSSEDIPTPGDYDGNGVADFAFWRPSTGEWHVLRDGVDQVTAWGQSDDIPLPKDYDGDGKTDLALWRRSTGQWFILGSGGSLTFGLVWGKVGDLPVPADYDGDGKDDIAVFSPSSGTWFILNSAGGITIQVLGQSEDLPVPADYDGDKKADIAIWRPSTGTWTGILTNGKKASKAWGRTGDLPVQADFDGDGRADLGLFRAFTAEWLILTSSSGFTSFIYNIWGQPGDLPVAASGGK